MNKRTRKFVQKENQSAFVLLLTIVFLVVLATAGYILSSRFMAEGRRNRYMIDYVQARYACDSAVKYALATMQEFQPYLISRPNEPDFSDLFHFTDAQYEQYITDWLMENEMNQEEDSGENSGTDAGLSLSSGLDDNNDINDVNVITDLNDFNDTAFRKTYDSFITDFDNPQSLVIRGPYGPPWPLVLEPAELEIGTAKVKIEIEDENAKFPVGWAMIDDEQYNREARAAFITFCSWMWHDPNVEDLRARIEVIQEQFLEINEIKQFKLDFKTSTVQVTDQPVRTSGRTQPKPRTVQRTVSADQQMTRQSADFAKIFHSSLVEFDDFARPTIESDQRKESALKYMGMWGSAKVNINTAPRHVLEAAFTFGGREVDIANEIIIRRQVKPFASIDDLKNDLLQYSDSIGKCEKFITTTSNIFTIRITAVSGAARASVVIAIQKDNNQTKRLGAISS